MLDLGGYGDELIGPSFGAISQRADKNIRNSRIVQANPVARKSNF